MFPFLKKFLEEHPYIEISLVNQSSYQTFNMLEEYGLDIGITTEPLKKNVFEYYPFMQYEYIFVATPSYINNLKLRDAQNIFDYFAFGTLMLLHKTHPLRQSIDQYFFENGFNIGHTLEVSNMDLLIDFSKMGMGIGYVIKNFVLDELENGSLIELPLDIPHENRNFGLTFIKTTHLTTAMSMFIDSFKEVHTRKQEVS
jgi:DNA-binding transcriptional LysR family regulator